MALKPSEWDAIQERAVNPFRSVESNAVNRLTRILTLGSDAILKDEILEIIDYKTVKVLANSYIKDDVYIQFDEDVTIDFTDEDNYYSTTDRGMDRPGIYYLTLHYVYNESIPNPIATFKILKNEKELTEQFILLCECKIENNTDGKYKITTFDSKKAPFINVENLRLIFDDTPTKDSKNPVTSDGIKNYVDTNISNVDGKAKEYADAIIVGGRNLLLNSNNGGNGWTSTNYLVCEIPLGNDKPKEGDIVTFSFEVAGLDLTKINVIQFYNSGIDKKIAEIPKSELVENGIIKKTETWKIGSARNTYLTVFLYPQTHGTATIKWVKLEYGNKATTWTPAPEDIVPEANSANKLNTNAGSSSKPVYFSNGVPVACSSIDLSTTGNATTATTATKVGNSLAIKLNGGTTEGTNLFTFNGSTAKTVNITPSSIGAAASSHTHDDRYYTESEINTKLNGKANSSHDQASNTINAMTGYSKPSSTSAIKTSDSLNGAIGKLEKALDGKQASGSYAAASHTHNYAGSSSAGGAANSVKTNLTIKLNGGTTEGTNLFTFNGSTAKTVNITPSGIGAAASSHTHNYAGSSSAGGAANSANKLNTNAGSSNTPVYFNNGVPVACSDINGSLITTIKGVLFQSGWFHLDQERWQTFSFPIPFDEVPKIIIYPTGRETWAQYQNVTNTGFEAWIRNTTGFYWLACGYKNS